MDGEGLGEDVADGHARIERGVGILEDDLHAAAEGAHGGGGGGRQRVAFEEDFAGGGFDEAEQHAGDGALAGAGFADQAEGFAGCDGEGDVVDDTPELWAVAVGILVRLRASTSGAFAAASSALRGSAGVIAEW